MKPIEITDLVENRSFSLLRMVGYIFLIFSLIDYIGILVPPRLTDPVWEFQAMGRLVEHVWSPLIGLVFIFFYTQNNCVSPSELILLRFLSWGSLILGLFYLLMLPLGINNSLTIYRDTSAQITKQLSQQTIQIEKLNQQILTADTPAELNNIAKIINFDNTVNAPIQELKNNLKQQIQTAEHRMSNAANIAKRQQSINFLKDAVRVNLGTVLAGAGLITVWNLTRWARTFDKDVN